MTEKTANTEVAKKIDWPAFVVALVVAPILVLIAGGLFGALTAPYETLNIVALVLVFAPFFGFPTYALVGGPLFALFISNFGAHPLALALVGLVANLVSLPLIFIWSLLIGGDAEETVMVFAMLGSVIAPIWAGVFGLLYKGDRRD